MLLLSSILIIYVTYVKSALTRGLAAHDCGGPEKAPTLPSPNYGLDPPRKETFFQASCIGDIEPFLCHCVHF